MSGPVDVLAEMQADIDALEQRVLDGEFTLSRGYDKVNRLRSIHATVDEVLKSGNALCDLMPGLAGGPEFDRLVAALANAGGVQ